MAIFTNYATLSYGGTTTNSNTVTGELLESLSMTKTAVTDTYSTRDDVTYVVSIRNNGSTAITGLSVTDDLGGYTFGGSTVYPLSYRENSILYYVNGTLESTPAVTAGPPLAVSGISVPALGNAMLVYRADVTAFAPPAAGSTVTNTASAAGGIISAPVTASETVTAAEEAILTVTKSVDPVVVAENGQLTYTFIIENSGSAASLDAVLTDLFDPILSDVSAAFNGTAWAAGTNYTYDTATGAFATLPGQITVPAASFTQGTDGSYAVTPGTAVLTVTGTV